MSHKPPHISSHLIPPPHIHIPQQCCILYVNHHPSSTPLNKRGSSSPSSSRNPLPPAPPPQPAHGPTDNEAGERSHLGGGTVAQPQRGERSVFGPQKEMVERGGGEGGLGRGEGGRGRGGGWLGWGWWAGVGVRREEMFFARFRR